QKPVQGQGDLTSGRASIWRDAGRILQNDLNQMKLGYLLVGHGLKSRQRLVGNKYTSWESDYLQAMMDQGIVGLLLVLLFYFYMLQKAIRTVIWQTDRFLQAAGVVIFQLWIMSFFTLKVISFIDAAIWVVLYVFLKQSDQIL
ncbi:MAG: hypothetical protein D6813_09035, partial [Calditrichaeota bacterium]